MFEVCMWYYVDMYYHSSHPTNDGVVGKNGKNPLVSKNPPHHKKCTKCNGIGLFEQVIYEDCVRINTESLLDVEISREAVSSYVGNEWT